jgi:hypothetical protein
VATYLSIAGPSLSYQLRAVFDCYLPALAEQLRFELPATEAKRRRFWTTFSQQLIYGLEPNGKSGQERQEQLGRTSSMNGTPSEFAMKNPGLGPLHFC